MTLFDCVPNRSYRVSGVKPCELSRRLLDMGFAAGSVVNVVARAPVGGAVLVNLRGTSVALRTDAAQAIYVVSV